MNYELLWKLAEQKHQEYITAEPFPHVVLDGVMPADVALRVIPPQSTGIWKETSNQHTQEKRVVKTKGLKERVFSNEGRALFYEFHSAAFLHFLETLTGIKGLLGDPYLLEGGFHMVGNRGFLRPHADFSHHPHTGLERRVNLLLYLNPDWREEWGGHIKLYDSKVKERASYLPVMNRCLIFSTSDTSYHGHPEPMRLPDGAFRKSLALYYYSLPTGRGQRVIHYPQ